MLIPQGELERIRRDREHKEKTDKEYVASQ